MSNVVNNANALNSVWPTFGQREMSRWGLSGNVEFAPMESVGRLIKLNKIDIDFPRVLKKPGYDNFDFYRYHRPYGAFFNVLKSVAKFANVPIKDIYLDGPVFRKKFGDEIDGSGSANFSYDTRNDVDLWNKTSVNENGDRIISPHFILVNDGDYVISKKTAISYPVYGNWTIDPDEGYHLSEIENDDWWEFLDAEDRAKLERYFG